MPLFNFSSRKTQLNTRKASLYIASFLLPVVCMIITGYIDGIGLFSSKSVLMWDAKWQYINFFGYLMHLLKGNSNEWFYSLSITPGGDTSLLFSYYLLSPLNLVLFFANAETLPYFFAMIQLIKIGLAGLCMTIFQRRVLVKSLSLKNASGILLISLCYSLCGYNISYMSNIMWLDAVYTLPLVALGIYLLVTNGNIKVYFSALAYAMLTCFYTSFMIALFSCMYFVYTMLKNGDLHSVRKPIIRFSIASLLAAGCACIVLLPTAYQLSRLERHNNNVNIGHALYQELLSLLLLTLIVSATYVAANILRKKFKGILFQIPSALLVLFTSVGIYKFLQNVNYYGYIDSAFLSWPLQLTLGTVDHEQIFPAELAHLYIGLLPVIVLVIYLIDKRQNRFHKILSVIFCINIIGMLYCYYVDLLWHGNSYPVGSPHRWSFIVSFFLLSLAGEYLCNNDYSFFNFHIADISLPYAIVIAFVLFEAIQYYRHNEIAFLHTNYLVLSIILGAAYLCLILLKQREIVFIGALIITCLELSFNLSTCLKDFDYLSYKEYKEELDIVNKLISENINDQEIYKIESTIAPDMNYINNYHSLYHYSSAMIPSNYSFANHLGFSGAVGHNQISNNLYVSSEKAGILNIKYLICTEELTDSNYEKITTTSDGCYLYKNNNFLPFAYLGSNLLGNIDLSIDQSNTALAKIIHSAQSASVHLIPTNISHYECDVSVNTQQKALYLQFPYSAGWHAKVDGKETSLQKSFNYFMRIPLAEGEHTVMIYYVPPYLYLGTFISLISSIAIFIYVCHQRKNA